MEGRGGVLKGSQVCTRLRGKGYKPPGPLLIACSGNCAEADVKRYRKAGAHLVWNKPYPMAGLMQSDLEQWWDKRCRIQERASAYHTREASEATAADKRLLARVPREQVDS